MGDDDAEHLIKHTLTREDKDVLIKLFDEALQNWLDRKFADFGKWSARGIAAMALAVIIWLWLHSGAALK